MGFIVFLGIIVAVVAIIVSANQSQKTRQSWAHAAGRLGLQFEAGGTFSRPQIRGTIKGFGIAVSTFTRRSGKNSKTYTRFQVHYPQALGLGLNLTQEGFFTGVAKFFGAQDVQVGDAGFDHDIVVKGEDPRRVVRFLTPARRTRVHRLLTSHPGAVIEDTKIQWEKRGTERDADRIISTIKYLLRVAWSISGDRGEDKSMDNAMKAQHEGRIEEALSILGERTRRRKKKHPARPTPKSRTERTEHAERPEPPEDIFPPAPPAPPPHASPEPEPSPAPEPELEELHNEPVEEHLLEAELLELGGRTDEAKEAVDQALAETPDDPELQQWSTSLSGVDTTPAEPPPPDGELDVASVCDDLFDPKNSSFNAKRLFEKRYQGKRIEWQGTLRSAESFSYDIVLGSDPGTKGVFEIHELPSTLYGERTVLAMVRLPAEAADALKDKAGETFTFQGELLRVDGFMRNVFVTDGTIQSPA